MTARGTTYRNDGTKVTMCEECECAAVHERGTSWTLTDEPDSSPIWDFDDDDEVAVWKCNMCGHITRRTVRQTKMDRLIDSLTN